MNIELNCTRNLMDLAEVTKFEIDIRFQKGRLLTVKEVMSMRLEGTMLENDYVWTCDNISIGRGAYCKAKDRLAFVPYKSDFLAWALFVSDTDMGLVYDAGKKRGTNEAKETKRSN